MRVDTARQHDRATIGNVVNDGERGTPVYVGDQTVFPDRQNVAAQSLLDLSGSSVPALVAPQPLDEDAFETCRRSRGGAAVGSRPAWTRSKARRQAACACSTLMAG